MKVSVLSLIKGDVVVAGYGEFDLSEDVPFTVTSWDQTKYSTHARVGISNGTATVALTLPVDMEVEI